MPDGKLFLGQDGKGAALLTSLSHLVKHSHGDYRSLLGGGKGILLNHVAD